MRAFMLFRLCLSTTDWPAEDIRECLVSFGLHFIKTGLIEDRLGGFLTRMEQLRDKGDYNCIFSVNKEELCTIVEPAHELVKVITDLIQK